MVISENLVSKPKYVIKINKMYIEDFMFIDGIPEYALIDSIIYAKAYSGRHANRLLKILNSNKKIASMILIEGC